MFTNISTNMFSIIAINIIMALTMSAETMANSWTQFHGDAIHMGCADFGPGASYLQLPETENRRKLSDSEGNIP